MVHDRILGRVRRFQRHGSFGSRRKQLHNHGEAAVAIEWHLIGQLGSADIALRVEEFNVRLLWSLAHWIMSRSALGGVPQGGFGQTVIESGIGKRSERKRGEKPGFLRFPQLIRSGRSPFRIYQMVRRELRLLGFVEKEDNLLEVRHTHQ